MSAPFHKAKWTAGYPETVSGTGSMMKSTENVRFNLPEIIKKYNIKRPYSFEYHSTYKILNVTVDFIAEVITCIKDKDKKIISGDSEKIKKRFSNKNGKKSHAQATTSQQNWRGYR